jgi:Alginate lyase
MRRSSFVVLLALVIGTPAVWTGGSVLAQPGTHHENVAGARPSADHNPFPSGRATAEGAVPDRPAAGAATRPGQLLDLRNWYLTLPTGSAGDPDTVHQPDLAGYSSPFFQVDEQRDGVVFTANAGGVTTKNSSYPRSELREMSGDKPASWSNRSGTHTLTVRQAVTRLPTAKPELVTAQIHDSESDVMEIRLEDKRLIAQYGGADKGGKKEFVVDPDYALGTAYDLRIVAAGGHIDVWYNDKRVGDIAQSGSGWYFKTGSYLQSNTDKGDAPNAVGKVVLYQVEVTHSG